jgi:hypothetical protein
MSYFLGLLFVVTGVALISGNKHVCYVLLPEAWLWKNLAGIEVGPLYRKTQALCLVVAGIVMLLLQPLLKAAL